MTGTAGQQRMSRDHLARAPFPVPPPGGQQRIVAEVNELTALCSELDDRLCIVRRNTEEDPKEQISLYVLRTYEGHAMARLVEAVLQAEGYVARLSPPGPDGGVDVLAGRVGLGGLLVSWGGLNGPADREARHNHFTVRVWDAKELLRAVFRNDERPPADLQTELPLKRVWALVPSRLGS